MNYFKNSPVQEALVWKYAKNVRIMKQREEASQSELGNERDKRGEY